MDAREASAERMIPVYRIPFRSNKAAGRAKAVLVAHAVVDGDFDLGRFSTAFWVLSGNGYAYTCEKGGAVFLHHVVAGRPSNMDVCHRNGNKLDCRRKNLEYGSRSHNLLNTADDLRADNTSGFRGVTRDDRSGALARPWRGKLQVGEKRRQTRRCATALEAAVALNELRRELGVPEDPRVPAVSSSEAVSA